MSLDRADRRFIRRAIADAVEEIIEAVDDALAVAAPDGASAPADDVSVDDAPEDEDEDEAAAGNPDDGHVAIPTHTIAATAQLKHGTRCVIVGNVVSVYGNVERGYASFYLRGVAEDVVRVILPSGYTAAVARYVCDGAIVAVDGAASVPGPRVVAQVIRVLAAPPPRSAVSAPAPANAAPTPEPMPAPKPEPAPAPTPPPVRAWPWPTVIECRVGCVRGPASWSSQPTETRYYVSTSAEGTYAQCVLHGNWLRLCDTAIRRTNDIPVYVIGAAPFAGTTRLWCPRCTAMHDTWAIEMEDDGRPRLYCSGMAYVDGKHRPLHAYHLDEADDGKLGLTYIPHPDEALP